MNDINSVLPCREKLALRARLYQQLREFFSQRGVLEVETPIFSEAGNTDPTIASITSNFSSDPEKNQIRFAHTSPEFAMKRLLARGSGSIYQICKVFRCEERGDLHSPEFTMLEWYRVGLNYHELMQEITELFSFLGIATEIEKVSYAEVFEQYLSIDVLNANVSDLKVCAQKHDLDVVGFTNDYDLWAAFLLSSLIEPHLGGDKPVFVYDFPASQAALSTIRVADNVCERFELYFKGIELANGYQELLHAQEYQFRFEKDNVKRKLSGFNEIPWDKRLISELMSGIPNTSGVALGLDRLIMIMAEQTNIDSVMAIKYSEA